MPLTASMVTVTVSEADWPALSEAEAVMVWVPTLSELVEIEAAVPRLPSRSEDQLMEELMLPSSASSAVPLKVTVVPSGKVEPLAGAEMLKVGAWLADWLTLKVWPSTVMVALRAPALFAATLKPTLPFPEPFAPEVMVTHEALLVAVQSQPD